MIEVQHCTACNALQYPERECCGNCLSTDLDFAAHDGAGTLLTCARVHHSLDPAWRDRLPIVIGTVLLDAGSNNAGPHMLCLVAGDAEPAGRVTVRHENGLFTAHPCDSENPAVA